MARRVEYTEAPNYTATQVERARLSKYGVEPKDKRRLEAALCALIDFESALYAANPRADLSGVTDALRTIVDGE